MDWLGVAFLRMDRLLGRHAVLVDSGARTHLAVPHGDMMLTGNCGLLRAYAAHDSRVREGVEQRLGAG